MIKSKDAAVAIAFSLSFIFLSQLLDVAAQQPAINNQSVNGTLPNTTTNQTNASANNTTNSAFDSLKDTFGSLFGK